MIKEILCKGIEYESYSACCRKTSVAVVDLTAFTLWLLFKVKGKMQIFVLFWLCHRDEVRERERERQREEENEWQSIKKQLHFNNKLFPSLCHNVHICVNAYMSLCFFFASLKCVCSVWYSHFHAFHFTFSVYEFIGCSWKKQRDQKKTRTYKKRWSLCIKEGGGSRAHILPAEIWTWQVL